MSVLSALMSSVRAPRLRTGIAASGPMSVWIAAVALAAMVAITLLFLNPADLAAARVRQDTADGKIAAARTEPALMSTSDPAALQALAPQTAMAINAARPLWAGSNPIARSFSAPLGDKSSYGRSLDCLTAAIYYEASSEPLDGQRAVAQVVLNRVRHPAYPHTICGVVFQGSERSTGCQFSFTCDGSLARIPGRATWERAREIALEALKGSVYRPVGLATHYHADYVVPWWAGSLVKLSVIGRHIFYRFGAYRSANMLNSTYAGKEPLVFQRQTSGAFALIGPKKLDVPPTIEEPAEPPIIDLDDRSFAAIRLALEDSGSAKTQASETGRAYLSSKAVPGEAKPDSHRKTGRWLVDGGSPAPAPASSPQPAQEKSGPAMPSPEKSGPEKSDQAVVVLAAE